jgi:hypothetical protein
MFLNTTLGGRGAFLGYSDTIFHNACKNPVVLTFYINFMIFVSTIVAMILLKKQQYSFQDNDNYN